MAYLITGNGYAPVTAQQDADLFQGLTGGEFVKVLPVGNEMAYSIQDSTTVRILDGECIDSEGRRIHIDADSYDDFTIPDGTSGTTAYYIIGYHLYTDSSTNEQLCEQFVRQMSSSTATIDEVLFRDGNTEKYVSLYRVIQDGVTLDSITALYETLIGIAEAGATVEEYVPFQLAIVDDEYGYYEGETFKTFRQPSGTAKAAQVLEGKTFANASTDEVTGTMANNGAVSYAPGNETISADSGYYSSVTVDGTDAYEAGLSEPSIITATVSMTVAPGSTGYLKPRASDLGMSEIWGLTSLQNGAFAINYTSYIDLRLKNTYESVTRTVTAVIIGPEAE